LSTPSASAAPSARIARLSVALLLAINMLNYVDRFVLAAVEPQIRADLFEVGAPDAKSKMGRLATAFLVSYMCAAPLFGWLADRTSRWKLVGLAVIIWSLASGGSGLAPAIGGLGIVSAYTALLATRLCVGIGEAAYGPSAPTIISDLFPVKRRGSVLAWFYMAIPVGGALGYAWGGAVVKWGGAVVGSLISADRIWTLAFYLLVPPGILLGLLCFLMPEPVRGAAESDESNRHDAASSHRARLADLGTLLRTPSYLWNTAGMTAMTFAIGGVSFWMPAYIEESNPASDPGWDNLIFGAITLLSGVIATLLGGLLADRLSPRFPGAYFLVSGIAMLLGFPCFLSVLETKFNWLWCGPLIFFTEFFLFFNTGPTNTIIANVTHPAIRSSAFALNILVIHLLGDAVSPWLIGEIADRFGGEIKTGFQTVSAAILIGGICWLCGARYLERDTKLAPTRIAE
jgi:MFS family permease